MKRIFVDTGAWDALADRNDAHHARARLFRDEIAGRYALITSNYVLDELYTLLLLNIGYQPTLRFKQQLDQLIQTEILQVVWVTEPVAVAAWAIFAQYNVDKRWSFTDCTSYVLMQQLGITEVFAFDRHFEQMGFLRRPPIR